MPITRTLLVNQAHRLKQLLDAPIQSFQSPTGHPNSVSDESSNDSSENPIPTDFDFSPDMYVDQRDTHRDSPIPTPATEPQQLIPVYQFLFRMILNALKN